MEELSQDARFLLNQIKGHLEGSNYNSFYYVEGIQSIAFGNLIGPSNTIPPANIATGQEMQRLRQKTAHALSELVNNGFVLFHEQVEGNKIYVMNENSSDKVMTRGQSDKANVTESLREKPQSKISKITAIDLLTEAVDAITKLKNKSTNSPEFIEWRRDTEISISYVFGSEGRHLEEFERIHYSPSMIPPGGNKPKTLRRAFSSGLDEAESILKSMVREIKRFRIEEGQGLGACDSASPSELFKMVTKSVFQENQFIVNKHLAFMLSPFGAPFDTIYENHIKPTVENIQEMDCSRADDIYNNRSVIEDIWRLTNEARIIVAELTGKNANVFYETGLAHAIGKEVILMTQSMDDVPFDLKHLRCIVYENTPEGIDQLKSDLTHTITNILNRTNP